MPSKVRFVLEVGGGVYAGGGARQRLVRLLEHFAGVGVAAAHLRAPEYRDAKNGLARVRFLMRFLGNEAGQLHVWRERRGVHPKESRYLSFMRQRGFPRPVKYEPPPPPARGGFNAAWEVYQDLAGVMRRRRRPPPPRKARAVVAHHVPAVDPNQVRIGIFRQ